MTPSAGPPPQVVHEVATVGTALVGYGYWGANLARNIEAASTLRLVGVCDSSASQRSQAATAHPSARSWETLDQVLSDDEVEAVVIAAPAALHAELSNQVLDAGRHVLIEKPMAMNRADAEVLVRRQETSDRIVMVGHTFLYSPPVDQLRGYIESGDLGRVQYLYSQRLSLGRIRRDCNALWNFAPHDVSIMLRLLGERPDEVSATSTSVIDPAVPDIFFASLRFPSGVSSHLHVSWIDPRKTRLMTIVGDQKMAIYNDVSADQKLWLVDAGVARGGDFGEFQSMGEFQWRTRAGDIHIPRVAMAEPLRNEMEAFGRACLSGEAPLTDARHGADVVAILEMIDRSAQERGAPTSISW